MNVDKPLFSTEMARHWTSVRTLIRQVGDGLAELVESEVDSNGGDMCCDDELLHAVRSLSKSLVAMFDIEESEECRAQILANNPELTEGLDAIQREHEHLAGVAAAIEDLCDDDEPIENWQDVERRFRDFLQTFTRHERREASLLQNAVSHDIGVGD